MRQSRDAIPAQKQKAQWRKASLVLGSAITGLLPLAATAQETSSDEIVVTGSRIPLPDYARSNPVTSIDATSIEYSGVTNVTELMERIPALVSSSDSHDNSGSATFIGGTGLNLLDLRGLGYDRTLVLVNGRRHVSGLPDSAAVDTNTIPVDLIDRVEVMTGGASAIYGADGVSGVVNFVLKDNFEGVRLRAQAGQAESGEPDNEFFSLTAGQNFADGRGNIAVSVGYAHDGRLQAFDRSFSGVNETRFARLVPGQLRVPFSGLGWFESGMGGAFDTDLVLDSGGNPHPDLNSNGGAWDNGVYPNGLSGGTYALGGDATPVGGYSGDTLPSLKRFDFNVFGHYDLTPHLTAFTELKYVNTKSFTLGQPTFDYFLLLDPDNYYLQQHPDIVAAAAGNGANAADLGLDPGSVLFTRDNFDFGRRGEKIDRDTYRSVFGLDGDMGDWGQWHASFTYGETDIRNLQLNNRYNDRYAAALDAVDDGSGNPICRSDLFPSVVGSNAGWNGWADPTSFVPGPGSGCVPIDIIGNGAPSQAAIDWIMVDSMAKSKITQKVFSLYAAGDAPIPHLPAGPIGYSVGLEWRRETSENTPAPEDQLGLTFNNVLQPSRGAFEVRELYAEINIPLLKDLPFAETLSIDGAQRVSQYTTVGSTDTWKLGGVWAPIHDIRFRGTHAVAIRAPNIGELFAPAGQDFQFIDDPCDKDRLGDGTSYRAANCATLLSGLGVADPSNFTDINNGFNVSGLLQGNKDLLEEKAETDTIGVILNPSFIPRLTLSFDWYKINLTNAINSIDPQDMADQCVDLPSTANDFCSLILRDDGTGSPGDEGGIVGFIRQPVNVASYLTRGLDFSVSYAFELRDFGIDKDWGHFGLRLMGNHLEKLEFVNLPGAEPDPDKGEVDAPEWQVNFDLVWDKGPWTINYGYNYFSETKRFATSTASAASLYSPGYDEYSPRSVHNIQVRFMPTDQFTVYAGIDNMSDQHPDLGSTGYPVGPEGRTFYLGLTAEFGAAVAAH